MERTANEQLQLESIRDRIDRLRTFLLEHPSPDIDGDRAEWYGFLSGIKGIVGNASNDLSMVATLMAKEYLFRMLPMQPFDAADKPQGASGLDIDECTVDGERVVAEIKTTSPYRPSDLGAAQKASFVRDFAKLQAAEAKHKFFFVTDAATYAVVQRRYAPEMPEVACVLLGPSDDRPAATGEGNFVSTVVLPLSRAAEEGPGG